MIIVDIKFWEYRSILKAHDILHKNVPFIIDASWKQSSPQHQEQVCALYNKLSLQGYSTVYCLMSSGDDDIEDLILYQLGGRAYPFIHVVESQTSLESSNDCSASMRAANAKDLVDSCIAPAFAMDSRRQTWQPGLGTLFVSGDRASVGKSTCCLGLLASLVYAGVCVTDLAYIKPVTQCEQEQDVVRFCNEVGIKCQGIGPVVFYKGFTRAFLNGETSTSDELVQQAVSAVRSLRQRHKFVVVDGVGYPAVGSICGISNAQMAKALQAPVWLVGKSGVGDAVDSYNLNAAYFKYHGCTVLGGIFNKLPLDGFYSLDACKEAVGRYFLTYCASKQEKAYGFIPQVEMPVGSTVTAMALASIFTERVQLDVLLADTLLFHLRLRGRIWSEDSNSSTLLSASASIYSTPTDESSFHGNVKTSASKRQLSVANDNAYPSAESEVVILKKTRKEILNISGSVDALSSSSFVTSSAVWAPTSHGTSAPRNGITARSREEIEHAARQQGAKGG